MKRVIIPAVIAIVGVGALAGPRWTAGDALKPVLGAPPAAESLAQRQQTPATIVLTERESAVCEVVFRWWLESGPRLSQRVAFLSIQGRDPGQSFLRRFGDSGWEIRPGSQFVERLGTRFTVGSLEEIGPKAIEVRTSYHISSLGAAGYTLWLESQGDRWVIVRARRNWMS